MINPLLPQHEGLDIEALGRIFNDTTNSYKLFFFRSLLALVRKGRFLESRRVSLEELALDMLVAAWIPTTYYRLSLGPRDQLSTLISKIAVDLCGLTLVAGEFGARLERLLREATPRDQLVSVLRYVPYRLLRPFFQRETLGVSDHRVNDLISRYAHASFTSRRPAPYILIEGPDKELELHEVWLEYLSRHLKILSDWSDWNLAVYLQRRNPNTPAIVEKLYLPQSRNSLKGQQEFWRIVMSREAIRCVYTHEILSGDSLHLDHFLPWSFVCHDELWNLIPTTRSANSSKGNCIPSQDYLPPFIDLQFRSLLVLKATLPSRKWDLVCASYAAGLRLTESELTNKDSLARSLEETILPLATIAVRMGFTANWKYQCPEA